MVIVVVVVIVMVMPPRPIFFLLFLVELAEVAMRIAVSLSRPAVVVDDLVVVPDVIVGVVRVVDADADSTMSPARNSRD